MKTDTYPINKRLQQIVVELLEDHFEQLSGSDMGVEDAVDFYLREHSMRLEGYTVYVVNHPSVGDQYLCDFDPNNTNNDGFFRINKV